MLATNQYRGSWEDPGFSPIAHSLLGGGIPRRGHPNPALACALNCPLHEPGRLGLLDELADIGEPSGLALCNHHR